MMKKDGQTAQLFYTDYKKAQAYGPASPYALRARNLITLPFQGYDSSVTCEWDADGGYKVTKVKSTTSMYTSGIRNLSAGTTHSNVIQKNHLYLFTGEVRTSRVGTQTAYWEFYYNTGICYVTGQLPTQANTWKRFANVTRVRTVTDSQKRSNCLFVYSLRDVDGYQIGDWYKIRNFECIDLTEMYGYGNEPEGAGVEIDPIVHKDLGMDYLPPQTNSIYDYTYIPTNTKTAYSIGKQNKVKAYNYFTNKSFTSTTQDGRTTSYIQLQYRDGNTSNYGSFFSTNLTPEMTYPNHYCAIETFTTEMTNPVLWRYKHNGLNRDIDICNWAGTWSGTYPPLYKGHKYFLSCDFISGDPSTVGGIQTDNMILLDLTDMFGEGNEPKSSAEVEKIITEIGYPTISGAPKNYFDFLPKTKTITSGEYLFNGTLSEAIPADTYTINWEQTSGTKTLSIALVDSNNTDMCNVSLAPGNTITIPRDAVKMRLWLSVTAAYSNFSLKGSTCELYVNSPFNWNTAYKYEDLNACNRSQFRNIGKFVSLSSTTKDGITVTQISPNVYHCEGTYANSGSDHNLYVISIVNTVIGHKYYVYFKGASKSDFYAYDNWSTHDVHPYQGAILTASKEVGTQNPITLRFDLNAAGTVINETISPVIVDLTAMFGAGKEPTSPYICKAIFDNMDTTYSDTSKIIDTPYNLFGYAQEVPHVKLAGYTENEVTVDTTYPMLCTGTYNEEATLEMTPRVASQSQYTGKNLFDPQILLDASGWKFEGECWVGPSRALYDKYYQSAGGLPITLDSSKVYTVYITGCGDHTNPQSGALYFYFHYTDGTTSTCVVRANNNQLTTYTATSYTSRQVDSCYVSYENGQNLRIKEFMVCEGTDTTYEPYIGRNLFNGVMNDSDSSFVWLSPTVNGLFGTLEAGTYTVSYSSSLKSHIFVRDASGNAIKTAYETYSTTFTLPTTQAIKIALQQNTLDASKVDWVQVEKGDKATSYRKYTGATSAPSPGYPVPIDYTHTEEIIIDTDDDHRNFNFPTDNVDGVVVWKPTDYQTDFVVGVYQENTRMKKEVGKDYIKIIPMCKLGDAVTDTAYHINTPELGIGPGDYALVFKYKKVNVQQRNFSWDTSYVTPQAYYTMAIKLSTTVSHATEAPFITRYDTNQQGDIYDEGWSYAKFHLTENGPWKFRLGVDTPNTVYVHDNRETYLMLTDFMLVKGNLPANKTLTGDRVFTIADGNKRICIDNKEVIEYRDDYSSKYLVDSTQTKVDGKSNIWRVSGNESWTLRSGCSHTFQCTCPVGVSFNGLCTHFTIINNGSEIDTKDGIYINTSGPAIITKLDCDNVNDFKAWLRSEYYRGTPVTIVYGLYNTTQTLTSSKLKLPMMPITSTITTNEDTKITVNMSDGKAHTLTKLNYIQSTKQQYIDTEWYWNGSNSKIVMDFEPTSTTSYDKVYCGLYTSSPTCKIELGDYKVNNVYYFRPNLQDTTRLTLERDANTLYHAETNRLRTWTINDTNLTETASNTVSQLTMFVFGRHYETSTQTYDKLSDMKLYKLELWDNDVLTKKFIPVLDENNVACLYEVVEGKCYYNKLTQPFTYG